MHCLPGSTYGLTVVRMSRSLAPQPDVRIGTPSSLNCDTANPTGHPAFQLTMLRARVIGAVTPPRSSGT